ncbi:tryptophan 7-halogenase [Sphingomonas sp. HITSZ_GF]|uniref:tryptophan halogenase family protein n=1 Tax=Sphingomonas sp. HITSZ_GF TaxID=3037247 RepID=UPI00240D5879|nr:tryptophan halogenase family protein [Sphingomonas sp. HITSZ_GF]MDG2535161.1 tryptophan 7-halogenase [Sphingomonas sp. HITSZ_GF]
MEQAPVRRVVIAGGGTAGWIAAAALAKLLGPLLEITLVESDEIGTIGVGESTIPTARTFHQLLGIDEKAFLRETQSTFKLGILFEDWARQGDRYIHSFGQIGKSTWMGDFHHFWLHARDEGWGGELGDYCFELQAAKAGRFAIPEQGHINYAYHLDAGLYARFLRGFAEPLGVRRIEGKIDAVEQHPETGFVTALKLASGARIEGDLFLDCTGFRGLLIEQTLAAGYEEWGHWLPTDSAIAVQTESMGPAVPYTRAAAHQAGWQWRIPLQHRVGNGLVYAQHHLDDDGARALLDSRIEGAKLIEPRIIRFKAGRRRKVWDRNVVALGLASGFVEPLESTSIHLIMIAITRLVQLFPFGGVGEGVAERFNALSRTEIEKIRDFIILHYHLNQREDGSFWDQCRTMEIPDTLAERIAAFRDGAIAWQASDDLFRVDSWVQVMLGQRLEPRSHHHMGRMIVEGELQEALGRLKSDIAGTVAQMPAHQAFLERYVTG